MSTGPEAAGPIGAAAITVPHGWRAVDFISDLHLCAQLPRTFDAWVRVMRSSPADGIFILGDLFEAWVGDDAMTLAFESQCVDVLTETARRKPVWLMHGNRDFLLGAEFFARTGVQFLADPCMLNGFGQRWLLSHGDALCLDDVEYQKLRTQVRNPAWQAAVLQQPLAERLKMAAMLRAESAAHQGTSGIYADADAAMATQWLAEFGADTLLHGHTHRPGSEQRAEGWQRHVLSDWDLDHAQPPRAEVMRLTSAGAARLSVDAALLPIA